jgi:hypothetical protein
MISVLFHEVVAFVEAFVRTVPGRTSVIARRFWWAFRFNRSGRVNIPTATRSALGLRRGGPYLC